MLCSLRAEPVSQPRSELGTGPDSVLLPLSVPLPFTVTKLQVSKSKRTLTLVENRSIQLNCSVKSQTSPNSHFAVLWYVHKPSDADGKLILKTTHSSAFEYGTYAEEEGLRGRLQFERHVSGGLFSLTVQRAEVSDSGSYYCHVEEWLLSPNYAWYKLAEEVSGRTEVTVKQPGKNGRYGHRWPVGFLQTLWLGELCSWPSSTHTPHTHARMCTHTQTTTDTVGMIAGAWAVNSDVLQTFYWTCYGSGADGAQEHAQLSRGSFLSELLRAAEVSKVQVTSRTLSCSASLSSVVGSPG